MVSHGQITPHDSDVWSGEKLTVPPLPPSYLVGCNIIDIKYYIQVHYHLRLNIIYIHYT